MLSSTERVRLVAVRVHHHTDSAVTSVTVTCSISTMSRREECISGEGMATGIGVIALAATTQEYSKAAFGAAALVTNSLKSCRRMLRRAPNSSATQATVIVASQSMAYPDGALESAGACTSSSFHRSSKSSASMLVAARCRSSGVTFKSQSGVACVCCMHCS